jgi:hypothetical protein
MSGIHRALGGNMRLTRLAKDDASGMGGCPTAYLDEDAPDYLVIQGPALANLSDLENVLPGEGAVRIKLAVLAAALRKLG